jgi:hypothetical protein
MTTVSILSPRKVATPRGALLGAWLFQQLAQGLQRVARAAGQLAQRRAQRRAESLRVSDASAVRRYAEQVMHYDARFAADLFAAAERHEQNRA